MAVAYVASAVQAGSGDTFAFTKPGGTGNTLVLGVSNYGDVATIAATGTGWTFGSPNSQIAGTGINRTFCSAATATYTAGTSPVTLNASYDYCLGCVAAFSGVGSVGTPTAAPYTGAQQQIPAYSVTNAGSMAVFYLTSYSDTLPTTITGWTRQAVTSDGFGAIYTKSVSAGDSAQLTGFTDSENSIGWLVILEATGGTNATVTPSTVAATATVPAPTVTGTRSATVTAAVVAAIASILAPTVTGSTGATVTPAVVAAVAAVPAPTVTGGTAGNATPAEITATASIPAPTVSGTTSATVTPTVVAAIADVGDPITVAFTGTYPASVSSRKWLDQNGDVYTLNCHPLWCMPQNGSDADITTVIEAVAAAGFNAIKVMLFGYRVNGSFTPFENDAGDPVFATTVNGTTSSTAYQSELGAAWFTMDHILEEASANGLTVVMSVDSAFGSTGPKAEIEAAYTADPDNLYNFGFDVATRYDAFPNIVWDLTTDDNITWSSTLTSAFDRYVEGIEAGETTARLWIAENNNGTSSYDQWPSAFTGTGGFTFLRLDANSVYDWSSSSVEAFDAIYTQTGATTYPVWDCEPAYVGGPGAAGANRQQIRERIYTTLIRGGVGINMGHEDTWPFGPASPFGTEGLTYLTVWTSSAYIPDMSRAWPFLNERVRDTTWAPTDVFVTTGTGTGDTKAAAGASDTIALAYFPNSRTIEVDTTILAGTGNVRLRWFDPTDDSFTLIAESEAQQTGRSVTHPGSNAAGAADWILVVDPPQVVTPATVAAVAAVPAPTVTGSTSDSATPATVAAVAAIPAPSVTGESNATVTASTVVAVADVPAPTVSGTSNATVTASTVAAVAAVPAPSVAGESNATVTPTVVATIADVPAPTVSGGGSSTVTPTAVASIADVPAPTVTGTSNATVTPTTVAAVATVPAPTVDTATNATVTPTTVAAVATVPAVTVTYSATITPTTVATVATVGTVSIVAGGSATTAPATISAVADVPAVTVTGTSNATITPTTVATIADVPAPTVSGTSNATVTPSTVAAVVTIESPFGSPIFTGTRTTTWTDLARTTTWTDTARTTTWST